ncbi:hypothetical protein [Rhizobium sp. WW_1]|jgi:hypothetical protein|uniref:hypothetical protein n=1 Tax=Rhizobium sp. WW_1 TaxID=1907375 RepID=UPI000647CF6D|nr:hypothetical protein [Rhizobium sp. WW_1]RKD68955.1 hypothetical protein BJ928_10493 [Rhizobium sp. WW_1]
MENERADHLEKLITELKGRCLMHELLMAHILASVGSASGNIGAYIDDVLARVGSNLKESGERTPDERAKVQFAYALKSLENFSGSLASSMRHMRGSGLN